MHVYMDIDIDISTFKGKRRWWIVKNNRTNQSLSAEREREKELMVITIRSLEGIDRDVSVYILSIWLSIFLFRSSVQMSFSCDVLVTLRACSTLRQTKARERERDKRSHTWWDLRKQKIWPLVDQGNIVVSTTQVDREWLLSDWLEWELKQEKTKNNDHQYYITSWTNFSSIPFSDGNHWRRMYG